MITLNALPFELSWTEVMGYVGSALVLISFLMTSVVKLRLVNMAGSIISCTYALIIGSYPLALMNFALVLINLHFLWKARQTTEKHYVLIETQKGDAVLTHLLRKYTDDILLCFPGLHVEPEQVEHSFLILCDDAPAGIVLGSSEGTQLDLLLDYSLPPYRDHSLGHFLREALPKKGYRSLIFRGPTDKHVTHLEKMGFVPQADGSWRCELTAPAAENRE